MYHFNQENMNTDYIVEKIIEISDQLEAFKDNSQVIVMHPSTMMLVREHITRYHDIYNTREAFVFDDRIPLYICLLNYQSTIF